MPTLRHPASVDVQAAARRLDRAGRWQGSASATPEPGAERSRTDGRPQTRSALRLARAEHELGGGREDRDRSDTSDAAPPAARTGLLTWQSPPRETAALPWSITFVNPLSASPQMAGGGGDLAAPG